MSLIEEALRRVHTLPPPMERPETMPPMPDIRVTPPVLPHERPARAVALPRQRPRSRSSWQGALIGAAGVLVLGWGIWTTRAILRVPGRARHPMTVTRSGSAPSPRRAILPLPARPDLELSGVAGGPGEPIAIINGSLLKPGETIEGATLLEVTDDSARLRWRDEDVVLHLAR